MKYNYTEDSLFHSIGYNFAKLESILQYGILSVNTAKIYNSSGLFNIPYTKNYEGSNDSNHISLISYSLINENDSNSSYNLYATKGISFIIEDIHYLVDKQKYNIHRTDEVLATTRVPIENITGITIPDNDKNKKLSELIYLPLNATKYEYILANYQILDNYLKQYNYTIPESFANKYLIQLRLLSNMITTDDIS